MSQNNTLRDLLEKRRSVRRFSGEPVSHEDIKELLWAGYGVTKAGRYTVPSAGACHPLRLYTAVKSDTINYYDAPLYIIIAADYGKITKRYGERGKLYTYFEVGHAAQNIILMGIELGLATVTIGGFLHGRRQRIMGIREEPLYIIAVGKEHA